MSTEASRELTDRVIRKMEEQFPHRLPDRAEVPSSDSYEEAMMLWRPNVYEDPPRASQPWGYFERDAPLGLHFDLVDVEAHSLPEREVWLERKAAQWQFEFPQASVVDVPRRETAHKALTDYWIRKARLGGERPNDDAPRGIAPEPLPALIVETCTNTASESVDIVQDDRLRLDLDYVCRRLSLVYPARQAGIWLESHNAALGGRPLDVLRIHGAADVIRAIDAEEQGAYS